MRAAIVIAGTLACTACSDPPPDPGFCAGCDLDNPLNRALLPVFAAAGRTPTVATPRELCARLSVDLLGAPMTAGDAERTCAGRPLDEVILEMQGTPDYLLVSGRHWADRFQLNDVAGDWRSIQDLYALVDALHRSELDYRELAIQAMAHAGLMTADLDARARVRRVFRSFMGRAPSEGEQAELAALFRPWLIRPEPDPDFPVITRLTPVLVSGLCEPLARCSTTLYGGATLELPGDPDYQGVPVSDLDDDTRAALRVPGELLTAQPTFAEAAADEILDRLLDWDEGERSIRTPGYLFPEVRQVLADFLVETGDYPAAERLVLTSWLYTQPAEVPEGQGIDDDEVSGEAEDDAGAAPAVLFVGPTKPLTAEAWLAGLVHLTSYDLGACDARYSDGFPYLLLADAYAEGRVTLEEHNEAMQRLHEMRGDRGRLVLVDGVLAVDYQYLGVARMLGGCPGFQASRQPPVGVSYALLQEGIAQALCAPAVANRAVPDGDVTPRSVAEHLVPRLLGRPASDEDALLLEEASGCGADGAGCAPAELVASACTALLGSAEYLFR